LATSVRADLLELKLPAIEGESRHLASLMGEKGAAIVFTGNGCPTARSYEVRLNELANSAAAKGVTLVAINSNNPALSPPDTVAEISRRAKEHKFGFTYLKDADGALARAFGAVCTPHVFLLDRKGDVVYEGRIDDSRMGDKITSRDLENAIADLVAGHEVRVPRTEPFGCSIVW
jgi:peroxiredoxin